MPSMPLRSDFTARVLIVASGDLTPQLGRTLLWRGDIERACVQDLEQAWDAVRSLAPNLVLIESERPETTEPLVRRIREHALTRATAIAVLSRRPNLDDEAELRAAGANVVFAGPLDPVLWDARLAELLRVPPRREARIQVRIVTWSRLSPDTEPVEGLALNISIHGMLVETDVPLETGTKLDLSFVLPGGRGDLRVVGQVVREAGVVEGRARSGVKFLVLRGDARERVTNFVSSKTIPWFAKPLTLGPRLVSRDAAERGEWEAELRASEARKTAILESVLDCIVTVDHEGRILETNRAVEKTFGYARSELLGRKLDETITTALRERQLGGLAGYLTADEAGLGRRIEVTGRRSDGSEFPLELAITPVQLEGRRLFTACLRDITDRKRAEHSLQESARHFRALFERATDAMVVTESEGRYVEVNPAACALYGLTRAELLGHWIGDFAEPGFDFPQAWRALREQQTARGEFRIQRPDGATREVEFTATADFLPGSDLAVLRDITEHRQLEAEFRQAQKMEAVGRLAGGVAHDFNNLLSVIYGYAELLQRGLPAESAARRRAEGILKAAERAAGLTRQLLAFSRRQVLQPRVFDLNGVVSEVEKMLGRLIGENINLVTRLDPGLGRLSADPGQIEQILMNLVVNARDAMPEGGTISIETGNADLDLAYARGHLGARPGPYVMLKVSDTGQGMDAETQRHIFEPFFTTKEKGKGTGLGLAMVYGIVKQSEGYIWVESQPGCGTTFTIFLPRVGGPADATCASPKAAANARGEETILLVEDEDLLRDVTREVLEAAGYRVLAAANGDEALRISGGHAGSIHLMLTDVVMPGMSGPELARRLACSRPDTKILFASGYTDEAIGHHRVLDAGTAFIQKPHTTEALEQKVREVLEAPPPTNA